ncbi:MAG: CARDB domain-containing protein, partial [Umezawaea sp.]
MNQLSRRLTSGILAVGLIALGMSPPVASAAGGPDPASGKTVTASTSNSNASANLAQGKTLSASSALAGYPTANGNDGDQNSYWESTNNAFPQWIQVDLGAAANVDQVVLKLPVSWGSRTQTLVVQGSATGNAFTDLVGSAQYAFAPAGGNAVTVTFTSTSTRYVRLAITANTGQPGGQLSEFEVYGPTTSGANLARGKAIEASSAVFGFVAANANDDSTSTYWESAGFESTLTVKLGSNADVSSVVVKLNPDQVWGTRNQTFEVLGREQSGTTFGSLKALTGYTFNPAAQNAVTIPVTGRVADVRLRFTANTGAPGGQVAELQVVGTPAPNPDLVVTATSWTPSSPNEASAISLSATVKNIGTAPAAASTVDFSLAGTVVGSTSVGALASGASATVSVAVGPRPMGSYTVSALVDPANRIVEQDDANNRFTAATPLVVAQAPGPDLRVTGITTNPPNPAVGAAVTFTVAVTNRGTSAVGAGTVARVTVGGTTLNGNAGAIAAGATVSVAISGTWTAVNGGATITATADATNTVAETNENNNTFTQSIVVGRGAAVPYTEYEAEAARYQ